MKCALQGGLQSDAINHVVAIYGPSFKCRIFFWFLLARALDAEKRAIIKKHQDFNHTWIYDNKFLLGEGVDKRFVLSAASFELAVNLALWVANQGRLL